MEYFTVKELTRSTTAEARKIDNTPTREAEANIIALIDNVLDPLRRAYGGPITVTSGYRSPKLNASVGGVKTSQHQKGQAADITVGSPEENKRLFDLAQELNLPFCQLIDEKKYKWVHISYDKNDVRRQVLHL